MAYAAREGQISFDGVEANSPFASAFLRHLRTPGLEISMLFRLVRDDVLAATGKKQEPFVYGSLPGSAFYFNPGEVSKETLNPRSESILVAPPPVDTASTPGVETLPAKAAPSAAPTPERVRPALATAPATSKLTINAAPDEIAPALKLAPALKPRPQTTSKPDYSTPPFQAPPRGQRSTIARSPEQTRPAEPQRPPRLPLPAASNSTNSQRCFVLDGRTFCE